MGRGALGQHVGVAAGVLDPAPVTFGGNDRCHHAIEEVAVVADQQHRAGIVGQPLLQQVKGFQIQIVGWLVEHKQVGRPGKRAGQGQPGALAT